MDVFEMNYYPPALTDWWMDDWISFVYVIIIELMSIVMSCQLVRSQGVDMIAMFMFIFRGLVLCYVVAIFQI